MIILVGKFGPSQKPHVLYCGTDGVESAEAAQKACDTGKYAKGGRILELRNPAGRPMAVVPTPPKKASELPALKQKTAKELKAEAKAAAKAEDKESSD